jgi:DNA-binding NarL/FixJ family response regulator
MTQTLRIGLLEDQPLFREMLQHLLRAVPGFAVVTAADCSDATSNWDARALDVALLDVELPDGTGLDVGRALQRSNPDLRVVLLSAVDRSQLLLEIDEREQWSYLSKNSSTSSAKLIRAIRACAAGRRVIDPDVVGSRRVRAGGRLEGLSSRHLEVLQLVTEGLTNQAIAERLGLALSSVNNHVNAIYAGLQIDRARFNPRVAAARLYLEETA